MARKAKETAPKDAPKEVKPDDQAADKKPGDEAIPENFDQYRARH